MSDKEKNPKQEKPKRKRRLLSLPRKKINPWLTNKVIKDITNSIRLGSSIDMAAQFAGITPTTVKKWLNRGNDAMDKCSTDPDDRIYMAFLVKVRRAVAEAQMIDLRRIDAAAGAGDWKAAAWKLTHGPLTREDWYETKKHQHTGKDGEAIKHEVHSTVELDAVMLALPLDVRKQIIEAYERMQNLPNNSNVIEGDKQKFIENTIIDIDKEEEE